MIFEDWTISLEHPTEGTHTASNTVAENLIFQGGKEDGQEFIRVILETTLIFRGDDYDYLKAIADGADACEETTITVANASYTWEGLLSVTDAEYNDDLKQVSIKPKLNDRYRCLLDKFEDEFSIYSGTTSIEVAFFQGTIERERQNFLSLPDINNPPAPSVDPTDTNWVIYETEASYNDINMDWSGFVTYIRQTVVTTCSGGVPVAPAGSGWDLRVNDCSGSNTSTYSKKAPLIIDGSKRYVDTAIEKSIFYLVPGYDADNEQALSMDNGRLVDQIIQVQINSCSLTLASDLLSINPPGTAPSNAVYDQKVNIEELILLQRSDVKNPDAFQNATKAQTDLKTLLEGISATLDVFWWIDGSDNLRIEHRSAKGLAEYLDLTATHPTALAGTAIYISEQIDFPRRQQYAWDESYGHRDFEGLDIGYANSCANGTEQYQAEWSTDVNSIYSTDEASNAGFVLVAAVKDGSDYYIPSQDGPLTSDELINGHLAWSSLQETYHTYERPFASGRLNNTTVTFDSVRRSKRQVVSIPSISLATFAALANRLEDPTLDSGITTSVGTGEVISCEYDVKNQTLTLTLLHA